MKNQAIITNLKSAVCNRKTVHIAGGDFEGEELQDVIDTLRAAPDLLEALEGILFQACENGCAQFGGGFDSEGEDVPYTVEHSEACKAAREALTKATGSAE